MAKAEKQTLKLEIEKPQYITVSDVTYAQVDSWFGHCRRDLKLDIRKRRMEPHIRAYSGSVAERG